MPQNAMADRYTKFMEEHGVLASHFRAPAGMSEYALRGGYRPVVQRPGSVAWRFQRYDDPEAPLAATDLDRMAGCVEEPFAGARVPGPAADAGGADCAGEGRYLAVQAAFSLPTSTYATMCLRELTKESTHVSHHASRTASNEAEERRAARSGGAAAEAPAAKRAKR
jgi:tRNA pseudouridine13 synthase